MGQEIVYCYKCQRRIVGAEFASGKAFQFGNHISCSTCAADLLNTLGPGEREQLLSKMFRATQERQSHSSGAHQAQPGAPAPTRRTKAQAQSTARLTVPEIRPAGGGSSILVAAGVGAAVVAVGLVLLIAGGSDRRDSVQKPQESPGASVPRPAPAPAPSPAALSPGEAAALSTARAAVHKARDVVATKPKDLEEQVKAWTGAADVTAGTPFFAEARRELDTVLARRADLIPTEWADLDRSTRAYESRQEFAAAIDLLQAARSRYSTPAWTQPLDRRVGELYGAAARAAAPAPASNFIAPSTPPPAAPVPPALSPAESAALARWEAGVGRASARDYAAALDPLKEMAADLEAVRAAGTVLQEALDLFAKWPRGQTLAVDAPERVEGVVLRGDAGRLAVKSTAGAVWIDLGDVTPACLSDLFRARIAKKPDDDRAAALFCLLEGDVEAARRIAGPQAGGIPEKYWRYGEKIASQRGAPEVAAREAEARELWRAGEEAFFDYTRAGPAVENSRVLLKDYASTTFVACNRVSIAARAAGVKDYLYCAENLNPVGSWKPGRSSKAEACWTCEKDGAGNSIDLAFTAFPNTEYRCWVYAGACCQETFAFSVQGTEIKSGKDGLAAEPGTGVLAPVRNSIVGLKKTHASHNGPKGPSQWAWIPIPLPKYATAGAKVIRLVTDQQGFSVAYAALTTQKEQPREADLKEFEHLRRDFSDPRPRAAAAPRPAPSAGKGVFAVDFSKGTGGFSAGEVVDAGDGRKALSLAPKGASVGGFSVVTRPSTVMRFRVKALVDLDFFECMSWIGDLNANAWYHVTNLKAGQWRSVEFKLGDMQLNWNGAPVMGSRVESMMFYYLNRPESARVLIADLEIRD